MTTDFKTMIYETANIGLAQKETWFCTVFFNVSKLDV